MNVNKHITGADQRHTSSGLVESLNTVKFLATDMNQTRTYHVEVINDSDLWYDQNQIVVFDASLWSMSRCMNVPDPGFRQTHPIQCPYRQDSEAQAFLGQAALLE